MTYYQFQERDTKKLPIGKIVCLGRTYQEHAAEMHAPVTQEPLLFLKPESSVIFTGGSIIIPKRSRCLHHEVELGLVIGRKASCIPKEQAFNYIYGYLVGLDITARDLQSVAKNNGWPWTIAKSFDTFTPISTVVKKEKISNVYHLDLELKVNGVIKQKAMIQDMIYSLEYIVAFVSEIMTLKPGDLILTGTPCGVGEIQTGDILEARLGTYCTLVVDVRQKKN
ncbi:MAG: fumarylacetoacetate hydrolase family protein [Candidatus Thermoplasmatota archaeon]